MRKILLTTSIALLCNTCLLHAQQMHRHVKGSTATAGKTTATDSRLTAVANRAHLNGNLDLNDSSRYAYTTGFGYDAKIDDWKYSSGLKWTYDGMAFTPFSLNSRTFDAGNRIIQELFQTYDGSNWNVYSITDYTYDAQGNIGTYMRGQKNGSNWDSTRYAYTYNAQGQLTTEIKETWDNVSTQWENALRTTHTYNAQGGLTTALYETWDGSQWAMDYRSTNTYTNNNLTLSLDEEYINNAWENADQTIYTYNVGGNLTVEEYQSWNNSAWEPQDRYSYTYNSSNDVTTMVTEEYVSGNYQNKERELMTYNSYHQLLNEVKESWDAGTSQFEPQDFDWDIRYYYEEYTNSVKGTHTNSSNVQVYPVPVRNMLQVRMTSTTATQATVQLLDMQGRTVARQVLPAATQHHAAIPVSTLPAGAYLLHIDAGGEVITRRVMLQ
jgi:hypothetical protein